MRRLCVLLVVAATVCLSSAAFAAEGDAFKVELNDLGGTGVTGATTFTDNGDGTTTVRLELHGVQPGTVNLVDIHGPGDCATSAPEMTEIADFTAVDPATGASETVLEVSYDELLDADSAVSVHASEEERDDNIIACGDEFIEVSGMPDTGAGGTSRGTNNLPLAGIGLAIAMLTAGTLLVVRSRTS